MYNESIFDIKRGIKYPEESKELAEFVGIMFGDGSMNTYYNKGSYNSSISIAGNSIKDKEYLTEYVSNLVEKLFNIKPKIYFRKSQNVMYLVVCSKGLVNFLETKGIKKGKKVQLETPGWIIQDSEYIKSFIRGIVDTDGCITLKKKYRKIPYYPTIRLSSIDKNFIISINKELSKLDIKTYIGIDSKVKSRNKYFKRSEIDINGYFNLILWLKLIGFNNPRNLNKINQINEQRKTLKRKYNSFIYAET